MASEIMGKTMYGNEKAKELEVQRNGKREMGDKIIYSNCERPLFTCPNKRLDY
jgi:hypothetical protein